MEDFKGLKFRIQASKAFEEFYKVTGAHTIVMPMSEVYQALQQGIIDGEDQHWNSFGSSKHWEVAKYATQCNYTYTGYLVCMNKKFYDGLPADIRTELNSILAEVQAWNWKIVDEKVAYFVAEGRKAGMQMKAAKPECRSTIFRPMNLIAGRNSPNRSSTCMNRLSAKTSWMPSTNCVD